MQEWLITLSEYAITLIDFIALAVILFGTMQAAITTGRAVFSPLPGRIRREVWMHYARWLVAGLTFQLAADIVSTSFAPSWDDVGRLAAVAAIRTFLSYFLDHEMESSRKLQRVSPPSEKRVERVGRGD